MEHVVERVTDAIGSPPSREHLGHDDVLIADGHHRYGVSRIHRDDVRRATGRRDTPAEETLAFVGELVSEQLSIEAIHRLYHDVPFEELRAALVASFTFEPADPPSPATLAAMEATGRLVLLAPDGSGEWLLPRAGAMAGVRPLDGAWLEHALAGTPAADRVTYQHGFDEVIAAIAAGEATAAVLIRPVSIAEIERTAREGLLMPPKSTFFTPEAAHRVRRSRPARVTPAGPTQASVLMLLSSSKACVRRVMNDSSPARSQTRGSYCFLFGFSGPLGLPIWPCR